MLDRAVRDGVERAVGQRVRATDPVSGGCISSAARVELEDGTLLFVKWGASASGMYAEEARSLTRLRAADALRTPAVTARGADWLALEWLPPSAPGVSFGAQLGEGLARLHAERGPAWGWDSDNYIGSLPQPNGWLDGWAEFWRVRRLAPQLERARDRLDTATLSSFETLLAELDARLDPAAVDGPSLLHGDLWHGNVHATADGPALIDPACCYGHREVDLAMAALFGGFPPDFETSYTAHWPLQPGWRQRRPIYQLYYLLVHVNLFGAGYAGATRRALESALD